MVCMWMCVSTTFAQQSSDLISSDSEVLTGKLGNGMTYYVKRQSHVKGRADFYIIHKVGAIQENDNQLGLAHFLEHMCFKGTTHFPDNNLISYCESLGLQFGTDLNATTRVDETVCRVSNVPTTRPSTLDSCLLILQDWSGSLSLSERKMDEERAVIQEEWRLRNHASGRLLEKHLPMLFPQSKYGRRTTMGSMDIVRTFRPKELVDFYHAWYHPSNQAVIVVGDIDASKMVEMIRERFSELRNPRNGLSVVKEPIPDNDRPIIIVDYDKELKSGYVKLLVKYDTPQELIEGKVGGLMDEYATLAFVTLLNKRLAQRAEQADCPFIKATLKNGNYIYASIKKALELSVVPKDIASTVPALQMAVAEVLRAANDGFNLAECGDFRKAVLNSLRVSASNEEAVDACKEHFLHGTPMPSLSFVKRVWQNLSDARLQALVQQRLRRLFVLTGKNLAIVNFNQEQARQYGPTKAQLWEAVSTAGTLQLGKYEAPHTQAIAMPALPTAGSIVSKRHHADMGFTELRLSNGAKVILKKTDMVTQPVMMRAEAPCGSACFTEKDLPELKLFNYAIGISGLGNLSAVETSRYLTDRQLQISMGMDNRYIGMRGKTEMKNLETFMQVIHLYLTAIRPDEPSYGALTHQLKTMLRSKLNNTDAMMSDSINATLYGHHPWMEPVKEEDVDKASYQRILEIARMCTSDMSRWTFYFTGYFDDALMEQYLCRYLAAVPSRATTLPERKPAELAKKNVANVFASPMGVPKSSIYLLWHNDRLPYSPENAMMMDIAGRVLSEVLLDKIRLQMQAAYTCDAKGEATLTMDKPVYTLTVMCPVQPGKEESVLRTINEEVARLSRHVDESLLDKVKSHVRKRFETGTQGNAYWDDVIYKYVHNGVDNRADYPLIISAQTAKRIQWFMKEFMKHAGKVTVVMLPKEMGTDLFHRMKDLAFVRKNIKTPMKRMAH